MSKFIIISVISLVLFFILDANVRIIRIKTPSIPYKYCLHLLKVAPKRGGLCVFKKNNLTIVKYIAAEAGDSVKIVKNSVFINGREICKLKINANFSPIMDQIIPAGYVFVMGSHPDSFDSRYEEFGLVKTSDIEGKAIGLWRQNSP